MPRRWGQPAARHGSTCDSCAISIQERSSYGPARPTSCLLHPLHCLVRVSLGIGSECKETCRCHTQNVGRCGNENPGGTACKSRRIAEACLRRLLLPDSGAANLPAVPGLRAWQSTLRILGMAAKE